MKKWIVGLIIIIAMIYPLYIVYHINENFHKTILEIKEIEAIDLSSHMIHNMDQSKHIGHQHTINKKIHLVHTKEDINFELTDPKFHQILRENISDLRISNTIVVNLDGEVIYSVNELYEHYDFKDSKEFRSAIKNQKPVTKIIHGDSVFYNGEDHHTRTENLVKSYVPILYKDKFEKVTTMGLMVIAFDISIMNDDFEDITKESFMILLGPIFIIIIMGYYSFERQKINLVLKKSENNLLEAQKIAKIGNWEWTINPDNIVWTKENHNIFEVDINEYVTYELFISIVHPDDRKLIEMEVKKALSKEIDNYIVEHRIITNNKSIKWIRETGKVIFDEYNKPLKMVGTSQDITIYKEKQLTLQESEEKFRLVTQSTHDAIVGIDDSGCIMFWNRGATKVFGYPEAEVTGMNFMALLPEEYIGGYNAACTEAIKVENSFFVVDEKDIELYGQRRDGKEFPMQVTLTIWPFKKKKIYSAIIKDITERKKFENKLLYQANYDKLTGLPNRNMIDDRLHQAEITARRNNSKAAVLFVDLDRFKYVNDIYGHDAGDELLKQVAQRLEGCVREIDTVVRLGGDEFLIILNDVKKPVAVRSVAKKVITQLSSKFNLKVENQDPNIYYNLDQDVMISGSVGIAFYPDDGISKDELMKKADAAMYQAKEAGKNNYKFYTSELDDENNAKLKIEKELRTALQNDEFHIVYQPIICLSDERIIGVEALLRWENPILGNVPPNIFIPIAEEIGLMPKLGDWIFVTSCKEMQSLNSDLYISINVSVAQLENPNFPKIASRVIQETGFPPELIQLEITETMMMKNIEKTIRIMNSLTKIGITVAIDDFGTGHSSLSYLKRIKACTLKIDKTFIDEVPNETDDVAIVKAIIKMAQSLNLKIIAEGIEKKEQVKFLKKLNCDRGQGYYYYKPMLISNLEKVVDIEKDKDV